MKNSNEFHNKVIGKPLLVEDIVDKIVIRSIKEYDLFVKNNSWYLLNPPNRFFNYIPEGIKINEKNKTIEYKPSIENYILEPTKSKIYGRGVQVWSVFKRKNFDMSDDIDSNYLVNAFRNKDGWRFKTQEDKNSILNHITLIIDKIVCNEGYNPTVVIPEDTLLNVLLENIVKQRNPQVRLIKDLGTNNSIEDVSCLALDYKKIWELYNNNDEKYDAVIKELREYLYVMDKKNGGMFSYHFIKNPEMIGVLTQSFREDHWCCEKHSVDFNGKDVLIVEDNFTKGGSEYECDKIKRVFLPKSITILRLFTDL